MTRLGPDELLRAIEENTRMLFALLPETVRFQRDAGFGRWIFVSSAVARTGGPGQAVYAAVKSTLESIMRTLAVEEVGERGWFLKRKET